LIELPDWIVGSLLFDLLFGNGWDVSIRTIGTRRHSVCEPSRSIGSIPEDGLSWRCGVVIVHLKREANESINFLWSQVRNSGIANPSDYIHAIKAHLSV
jgi:hypothetical protein